MDPEKLKRAAKPTRIGAYVKKLSSRPVMHMKVGRTVTSTRADEYNGHKITIDTTYEVKVDGRPLGVPLEVDNTGRLYCHSLPNYSFASAVDAIKTIMDTFPEAFARKKRPSRSRKRSVAKRGKGRRRKRPAKKKGKKG